MQPGSIHQFPKQVRGSLPSTVLAAIAASLAIVSLFAVWAFQSRHSAAPAWRVYKNTAFGFSFRYPGSLAQVKEGEKQVSVFGKNKETQPGFTVTVEGVSASSTDEWLRSQPPGGEGQEGYQSMAALGTQEMRLVARFAIVGHNAGGQAVTAKMLEGVEVKNRLLFKITYANQTPSDRAAVLDQDMAAVMESFTVEDRPISDQAGIAEAAASLLRFLSDLHDQKYAEAACSYGSDYDVLRDWNPSVKPDDLAALWRNGCEKNGLRCLKVRQAALTDHAKGDTYVFSVSFSNPDGSEFARGPCCGQPAGQEPPQTAFPFTVTKSLQGEYKIQTMPVYTP